jgi:hypothetical protein
MLVDFVSSRLACKSTIEIRRCDHRCVKKQCMEYNLPIKLLPDALAEALVAVLALFMQAWYEERLPNEA